MWNEEEFMGWVEIIRSTLRALPGEVWYQDFDYCDEEGIYETPQPTTCVVNDDGDTVANCSDVVTACFVGNTRRDLQRMLDGVGMLIHQRDECRASLAEALDVLRDVLAVVWDKSLTLRKSDAVDNGHRLLARHEEQSAEIAAVDAELSELEEVNAELDEEDGEA